MAQGIYNLLIVASTLPTQSR